MNKRMTKLPFVRLMMVVIAAVVLLGAAYLVWMKFYPGSQEYKYDTSAPAYQTLLKLQRQAVPSEYVAKIEYYASLSSAYETLGNVKEALKTLLAADKLVEDRSIESGMSLNVALARLSQKNGDKDKARQYYQKEIDRIKNDPHASENQDVIKAIEGMKAKV